MSPQLTIIWQLKSEIAAYLFIEL